MAEDYRSSRRNKERDKGIRRGADDDYYYRDTEDTIAYHERKHDKERYYQDEEAHSDDERLRKSPEKSSRHREKRERRERKEKSLDHRKKRSREGKDERLSRKEKSVHYKEEKLRQSKHSRDNRGRSKERSNQKHRNGKTRKHDIESENNDISEADDDVISARHTRKLMDNDRERKSRRRDEGSEDELTEVPPEHEKARRKDKHLKEKHTPEKVPHEDSLEKVRRERSKESRRKKSRDRKRGESEENDKRRSKSKIRRKFHSKTDHEFPIDASFAVSETYEEMKKSSQSCWENKISSRKKDRRYSDDRNENNASDNKSKEKLYEKKKRSREKREKTDTKEKKKSDSKIRQELRKKYEPRLCHSDSEIDMTKSRKSKSHLSEEQHDSSSNSHEEKPMDIDSLYNLYKDPDPNAKPAIKEVIIQNTNDNTTKPKKISIDQTDIRSKLIKVLFQRVKELLKETELLRSERKTLCQSIEALSDDLESMRKKDAEKSAKEVKLEERLSILADEMKITAKGTSFREEIQNILHDIQTRYQTHWKEHETKIQQVQNEAENNIQNLMKNIVGKYVELSELNDPSKTPNDIEKTTAEFREVLKLNGTTVSQKTQEMSGNIPEVKTVRRNIDRPEPPFIQNKNPDLRLEENEFSDLRIQQKNVRQNRKEEALLATLHRERQRMLQNETTKAIPPEESNDNAPYKLSRLNQPLFIDTQTYAHSTESYPDQKIVKTDKDLLLQIAPTAKNNTDNFYHFNQRPTQLFNSDGKDPLAPQDSLNNEQTNKYRESNMRPQQVYEEAKTSLHQTDQARDGPVPVKYPHAFTDIPTSKYMHKLQDEEEYKNINLKMDTKEFWRHKLLQRSPTQDIRWDDTEREPQPTTNVRNTY